MQLPAQYYIDAAPTALNTQNYVRPPAFAQGYGGPEPMVVHQTFGHYSRPKERFIVRHYRYFFTISQ